MKVISQEYRAARIKRKDPYESFKILMRDSRNELTVPGC